MSNESRRFEIVIDTSNPDIEQRLTTALWAMWDAGGLDFDNEGKDHRLEVALFEVDETGRSGDAIWLEHIKPEREA